MKNVMTGTYTKGEEDFNFDFYTELSTANKLKFVNFVSDILVDDKNYNSILRDLLFDFAVIDIFTNVDTTELRESSLFVKDVESFLEETNIVDIVKANVEDGLIEELNKAIDLNVRYKTGIHVNPLNEALASLMNTIQKKIVDIDLDSMMEMAQKLSGMSEEFTPENIVNAYLKTDVAKKNADEVKKARKKKYDIANDMNNVINFPDKK